MSDKTIIEILKNIKRFDDEKTEFNYFTGWNSCLDTIILDFKEMGLDINKKNN